MGVYAYVHICIERGEPLSVDRRVAVVELAMKHELITQQCAVRIPKPVGIRGAIKSLFGLRAIHERTIQEGPPGPWIAERVRAIAPDFSVSSPFPMWKGTSLTGPFEYTCFRRPRAIKVVNPGRSPEDRSPHEPPDGVIGRFFDVIEICAARDFDARIAASSGFVRELKMLTGGKVICRTEWV